MAEVKYPLYNADPATTYSLCADVAARLDIGLVPTTSSRPTLSQVKAWLNLAQVDIVNKAVDAAVSTLWKELVLADTDMTHLADTYSNMAGVYYGGLSYFVRPIDAELWRAASDSDPTLSRSRIYPVFLLAKDISANVLKSSLYSASVTRPIGWIQENRIYVAINTSETLWTGDKIVLRYIQEPALLSSDGAYTTLPRVFQDFMIQFAVIQAKIQDGRIEEASILQDKYEKGIQAINQMALTGDYGIGK